MYRLQLSSFKVEQLCASLCGADSDYVDWRQFIVCAAQPWPLPSAQDLVDALRQFSSLTSSNSTDVGLQEGSSIIMVNQPLQLNKEQFMASDLWLTKQQQKQEEKKEQGEEFNRNWKVKEVLFIFVITFPISSFHIHNLLQNGL